MHREIEDVIVRIASGSDEADLDMVAELLTDDVTFEMPAQGLTLGPGRDEILAYVERTTTARASRGERGRHLVTNIRVDPAQDGTAIARSYITFLVTTADGTISVHGFACYEDRLVHVDDAWRLAARRIIFDRDQLTTSVP